MRPARLLAFAFACASLLATLAHAQWAPSGAAGQWTAAISDPGKALALASGARVLVVGQEDRQLSIVDPDAGTVLGQVALPEEPRSVAISADGARAYVVYGSDKLSAVDVAARSVLATWTIGGELRSVVLMAGEAELAVADAAPSRLVAVDATTGTVTRQLALPHEPREVISANGGGRLAVGAVNGWLMTVDSVSFALVSQLKLADEIRSLAWWEAGARLLAVHKRADAVSLVDITVPQVTSTVPLDGDPDRAAVAQGAGVGYVGTHDDASVNRVDLAGPALLGRYAIAARVNALVFDPVANVLYGAPRGDQRLLRLDPAAASLVSVLQLQKRLRDVAINSTTHEAVAVADKSDEMFVITLAERSVRTIALPARPDLVAVDSTLNQSVVAFRGSGPKLRFADLATNVLFAETISYNRPLTALAVDPSRALALAIAEGRSPVLLIDLASRTRLADGPEGLYRALAVHAGRGVAYLATEERQLKVLDIASRAIVATLDLGFKANAIAVDEALDKAVVTAGTENQAHVLDLATLTLQAAYPLPNNPGAVALQTDTHVAVVASRESDAVSLVDLASGLATPSFTSIEKAHALAVSNRYNEAVVLSGERDEVTFVQLPNPVPVLQAISPALTPAGTPALVLSITGTGFVDASKAYFGEVALTTRWQSATELEADVPAELLVAPGSVQVTVRNPAPAGGTSNALAFDVIGAPTLAAIVPGSAIADGEPKTLALTGENFFPGASVLFGAATLPATVHSPTSLTVVVPGALIAAPATVAVSVVNPGGLASNSLPFTLAPLLAIHAIAPTSGEVGTLVTITGTGFDPVPGNNHLVFRAINNTTVATVPVSATTTAMAVKVPGLAESGPIILTNSRGTVQSPPFSVVREQDYQLVVSPPLLSVYQGASGSLQAQLASTGTKPFTGLVSLSVQGLPGNVAPSFAPQTLSAFQNGTITFGALGGAAPGTYPLTITAEMKEAGQLFTRTASATLTVLPSAGVTGVKGRFVTPEGGGIAGVIVRADIATDPQPQTVTDAAGNFQLAGLPAGELTLRFDATPAHPLYPIWPQTITVPADKVLVMEDWVISPPPPDERFTPIAANSPQEQVITDPRYPGLEIKIPAGTTIVGWDGVPKSRIAVERLDPDKLAVPPPPIKTKSVYQLYFGTPMGGLPSNPIPVTLPNDLGLEPGSKTPLWYYDGSPMGGTGEWKQGGTGTVSADGSVIITDSGSGIPRFCGLCGLPCFQAAQNEAPNQPCCDDVQQQVGKPVNLATGQELESAVDLVVDGEVPIVIRRVFNPFDAFAYIANFQQSLGVNWVFGGYDVAMLPFSGDFSVRIVLPGNSRADFRRGADGRFRSGGYSTFDGAEVIKVGGTNPSSVGFLAGATSPPSGAPVADRCFYDGSFYLVRFKDGRTWRFDAAPDATILRIRGGCLFFLSEMRDAQGRFVKITRSKGKLQRIETSSGQSVDFGYTEGVVSSVTDNTGRSVLYNHEQVAAKGGFAAFGSTTQLVQSFAAAALAAGLSPLPPRRVASVVTPEGTYAYTYEDDPPEIRLGALSFDDGDGAGFAVREPDCREARGGTRIKTIQLPGVAGVFTNYYGPSKRVLRQTWPDGTDIRFNYKVVGGCVPGVISSEAQPGGSAPLLVGSETNTCSGAGCVRIDSWDGQAVTGGTVVGVDVTDSRGRKFGQDFNGSGLAVRVLDENGQPQLIVRDAHNRITRRTDAIGRITQYQYDGRGNRTRIVDPAGRETNIEYDPVWNKPTLVSRRLDEDTVIEYRYSYDPDTGTLATGTDPEGNVTEYEYDTNGRLALIRDPLEHATTIQYDGRGNPRRIVDALGNAVEMLSDAAGRIIRTSDGLGNETRAQYNALNQLTKITDAKLGETRFNFDARNNLASVVNPLEHAIESYGYDSIGRLVSKTDAHQRSETYGYDGNGNLASITDRRNQVTTIEYDHANRPLRITYHDGTVQERTYDAAGRLTEIREPDNAQRMEYDVLDRVVRVVSDTLAGITSIGYEYDALDRRTKRTVSYPGGVLEETAYAYDKASRLLSITQTGVNGTQTTLYTWDAASRLAEKTLPNGLRQQLDYDDANRLLSITYRRSDDSVLERVEYTYDANGQRVLKASGTPALADTPFAASYDAANRMSAIILHPGSAAQKTYTLAYDEHGNLAQKTNVDDPAETTLYTWDARNRLVAISASDGAQTSTAEFKYDTMGRRIARTITQGTTTQQTQYAYDGIQAIGEFVDNRLAATVLAGLSIDEVIARTVNVSGGLNPLATKTYLTDALGTVIAMAREDQTPEIFYAYSAFGETAQLGIDPDTPANSNQYTARESDSSIGGTAGQALYFYRARYYDPVIKRFVSEDPIGINGDLNFYAYVRGDPVSYIDPTGELALIGALIGGGGNFLYQLYQNGGRIECINWWQVGAWALGGSGAGLIGRAGISGATRFFWDPRKISTISRQYWRPGGAGGMSLDHWAISQAAGRSGAVPQGIVNGGWNLLQMPATWNTWLGFAPNWGGTQAALAQGGRLLVQGTVVGTAAGSLYGGYQIGTNAQSQPSECCK